MKIMRTPDERFRDLKDYPFAPNYLELEGGLRMHYLDEGPIEKGPVDTGPIDTGKASEEVVLMLHGEPSWSYLYRYMIPVCAAEHRVVAPDLIGFGKSDKPASIHDYSYQTHMDWMKEFIVHLDLKNITLVCQDWGSLIGLRLAAENEERFARIVVGNGFLPTGRQRMPRIFKLWRGFARFSPYFPISRIINSGSFKTLDDEERRAYDAPFPSSAYKAGSRAFPRLVPTSLKDPASAANIAAWKILETWEKPFLTTFSNGDPITRGADKILQERIPGAAGRPHTTLRGGHFLQEDAGPEFARAVNELIAST